MIGLAMPVVSARMVGELETLESLRNLSSRLPNRAMRSGMTKAARLIRREMKVQVPRESGVLKQHLDFKVYTNRYGMVGAVIGPENVRLSVQASRGRRKIIRPGLVGVRRRTAQRLKRGQVAGAEMLYRNPAKYAHLVEGGRKRATPKRRRVLASVFLDQVFGPSVAAVAPNPFMFRTYSMVRATAEDIIASELRIFLEREIVKLA